MNPDVQSSNSQRPANPENPWWLAEDRLPKALADLAPEYLDSVPTDPFDDQPLHYRKLDPGYMIYSVGKDGKDDGGREPPPRIKSTDTNSYDLTFIVER